MKIFNVIELVDNLLQLGIGGEVLEDALAAAASGAGIVSGAAGGDGEKIAEISRLVSCANLVFAEVSSVYFPLVAKMRLVCGEGGVLPYSAFEKPPAEVLRASLAAGGRVRYRYRPDHIELVGCGGGEAVDVVYSYKCPAGSLNTDIPVGSPRLSERIVAYGTAAEFCLLVGRHDDAVIWDKRYKDALFSATCTRGETHLPQRRWD